MKKLEIIFIKVVENVKKKLTKQVTKFAVRKKYVLGYFFKLTSTPAVQVRLIINNKSKNV